MVQAYCWFLASPVSSVKTLQCVTKIIHVMQHVLWPEQPYLSLIIITSNLDTYAKRPPGIVTMKN